MIFEETNLSGAYVISCEMLPDERGFFARAWCKEEFSRLGLDTEIAQCSISYNSLRGTVRGMHFQNEPHSETKIVRCTAGAIYDVIVDMRKGSPTFMKWNSTELSADNRKAVYIPKGFAHGFQTLEDKTEVYYQFSAAHNPDSAGGLRWNDPKLAITWPLPVSSISKRDRKHPLIKP